MVLKGPNDVNWKTRKGSRRRSANNLCTARSKFLQTSVGGGDRQSVSLPNLRMRRVRNPIKVLKLARNSNFQVYFHLLAGVFRSLSRKTWSNYFRGSPAKNKILPSHPAPAVCQSRPITLRNYEILELRNKVATLARTRSWQKIETECFLRNYTSNDIDMYVNTKEKEFRCQNFTI